IWGPIPKSWRLTSQSVRTRKPRPYFCIAGQDITPILTTMSRTSNTTVQVRTWVSPRKARAERVSNDVGGRPIRWDMVNPYSTRQPRAGSGRRFSRTRARGRGCAADFDRLDGGADLLRDGPGQRHITEVLAVLLPLVRGIQEDLLERRADIGIVVHLAAEDPGERDDGVRVGPLRVGDPRAQVRRQLDA